MLSSPRYSGARRLWNTRNPSIASFSYQSLAYRSLLTPVDAVFVPVAPLSQAAFTRSSSHTLRWPSSPSRNPLFTRLSSLQAITTTRKMTVRLVERLTEGLEKPSLDDRSYRVVQLPNKLEALLVHDAETDKAAAAMDVNVGSFSDPQDLQGLAHGLEHMLFMGTEKYPKENAYNQYLASHSGSSNAYTAGTETNYFFEVSATGTSNGETSGQSTPNGTTNGTASASDSGNANSSNATSPLYGALDRFAQFFISPLFLENTLDREMRAVDSENKKNLQSDVWRLMQLNKSLSNPAHPYNHFSTGNLQTLKEEPLERGLEIRNEFMKFYDEHYSANRMKLVVLGRDSLDEMEQWVSELFAEVKNKDLPQNRWDDVPIWLPNDMCKQIFAKPVMDSRSVDIYFPFLDEENLYETQPSRYISHLIGHEGPGSILAHIKAKGWANGLSAGVMPICPGAAFFTVSVRLTQEGLKQYQEVVKVVFEYIAMIKEREPEEWIYDEMKNLAEVEFRFKQKSPASRFTSRLSSVMQKPLPREWLLSGSLLRKFDAEGIKKAFSYLREDNFKMIIVAQDYPGDWDTKEKWYGTEYKVEDVPQDFMADIRAALNTTPNTRLSELHMPHKNEFVPTRLSVEKKEASEPAKTPKLIRHDDHVRLWFKKDDRFWVPKATLCVTLRNPLVWATPSNLVKSKFYCELVRDALVEYSYDAELAGLDYHLSASIFGLDISVGGYNDKMAVLLEKVISSMRDLSINPDRFRIIKERLSRSYKNAEYQQPYYQVGDYTRYLTAERSWLNEQYAAELEHIEAEDIQCFFPQILRQNHIEVLAHGNIYKEDALRMTDSIESILKSRPLPQSQWHVRRNMILPPGSNYIYERALKDPVNVNHCIEYYLFIGDLNDQLLRSKLLLFAQMTEEPAFDQLRSKEQLGYVVWSGVRYSATTMGYRVIIQSERAAQYLESRIDAFLASFGKTLETMSEDEFEGHKRSVINKRLERLKNLSSETSRFWSQIGSEYFDFQQNETDAACVRAFTKSDILDFYKQMIDPASTLRAKISTHMKAQAGAHVAETKESLTERKIQPALEKNEQDSGAASKQSDLKSENGSEEHALTNGTGKATALDPIYISNVTEYKARLAVSTGPSPVTDLTEFEDFDAKL
ncbi:Metalloenzyme, LuxS/M16 peptidase-like protein [Aspergillus cavernicola]|uniref:Metalloenzyme, LuxS/M16 peptidase-like protein n=1 Tax=Aspergillus cavernicola TaxID=176166 RepID=A0ABR4IJW5_9EURO